MCYDNGIMSDIKDKTTREFSITANADMARSNLQIAYQIDGESDTQIIRAALNGPAFFGGVQLENVP